MPEHLDVGDRMKRYESVFCRELPRRIPVIIRVDGRAFHGFTKKHYGRSWSLDFTLQMALAAQYAQSEMQGCTLAYGQSDEVSFLLTDYKTIHTERMV